jgi:hypothetical protein
MARRSEGYGVWWEADDDSVELGVRDEGMKPGWAGRPLADWRGVRVDQRVDGLPAELRERLAGTAERVARTFAFGVQVRAGMAAWSPAREDYHRSRAAWNQMVADFERRQARALRDGRLLAIPWRPVPRAAAADRQQAPGQP